MKTLNFLFIAFIAILMFPFSGLSSTADNFVEKAMSQDEVVIHRNGIDLSELNSQLGAYMRKFEKEIWRLVTADIEFEKHMTKITGVTDEYVATTGSIDEVLQPFQNGWTPKGTPAFVPYINKVRQIKADIVLDNVDNIYRTYLAFLAEEGVKRSEWPLVRYIVTELIVPKIKEEIADISVNGEYAAPTPGTPGDSLDSADGILKIIDNGITSSDIVPITTGVITQANIIDKLENSFYGGLPEKLKSKEGKIFLSSSLHRMYFRAYRDAYGSNMNYSGSTELVLDGTNTKLIAIPELNGSQRIIYTTPGNMLCMYDKIYTPERLEVQLDKRDVVLLTDFKRGWGFKTLQEVYVNDQA